MMFENGRGRTVLIGENIFFSGNLGESCELCGL